MPAVRRPVRLVLLLSSVLALLLAGAGGVAGAARADQPGQQLLAAYSAEFWQWAYGTPMHTGDIVTHPLLVQGHVDCSLGQHGNVWFLGGNYNGSSVDLTRRCTVPSDVALFLPVYNSVFDNSNCDGLPPTTFSVAYRRALLRRQVDGLSAVSASIDGRDVKNIRTTGRYQSPRFAYTTPADSLVNGVNCAPKPGFAAQTVHGAVADGIYLAVAPLRPGRHTLHVAAARGAVPVLDVTYVLDVVRR